MEFENDVFVSYAHIDDQALIKGQTGWISNLHRHLQVRLEQLLGKEARIWRDPTLQGNDVFADRVVDRLPGVAHAQERGGRRLAASRCELPRSWNFRRSVAPPGRWRSVHLRGAL